MPAITERTLFDDTPFAVNRPVNVASVPNRSPFRYPGGKTWLVPTVRLWLSSGGDKKLVEPFCGGATVGLTAVAEGLVSSALLVEKDRDVASVWSTILNDGEWLAERILGFQMTAENVAKIVSSDPSDERELAFKTIIRNRTNHGGILASGSGVIKNGENHRGISSRWYPVTLARRIRDIAANKSKIVFVQGDAFDYFDASHYTDNTYYFIDPPYTVAGRRLYTLSDVDHDSLFDKVSHLRCHYLMTYDNCDYVKGLADKYGLRWRTIPMQTTHLVKKEELLISNDFSWLD